MDKQMDKNTLVNAGLELTAFLIDMALKESDSNSFLKSYLSDLTSDKGIYKQQQDALAQFGDSSLHIEQTAQDILGSITESSRMIDVMSEGFLELNKSIASVTQQRALLNTKMQSLSNKIKKIDELINSINEISEQTNLLSFNASIEAAHAGEAGKGFRIIANEVKKLSSQTAQISKSIADNIADLSQQIQETAEENASHNKFFDEIKSLSDKSNESLNLIKEQSNNNALATQEMYREVKLNQENILKTSKSVEESNINQVKIIADKATGNSIRSNDRLSFLLQLRSLFQYINEKTDLQLK